MIFGVGVCFLMTKYGVMHQSSFEKKTQYVVILTAITMVAEIFFGLTTNSMALLADGIHMGSHVLAIGLSWFAYVMVRRMQTSKLYSIDGKKILSLSGYTSGLILLIFAVMISVEAVQRILSPKDILFKEAIGVAVVGLVINLVSAAILHHDHEESDHNIKAAYLHVLADAVTSIAAIAGLVVGMLWGIVSVDAIAAILSSLVIVKWSVGLLKEAGSVLLEVRRKD